MVVTRRARIMTQVLTYGVLIAFSIYCSLSYGCSTPR